MKHRNFWKGLQGIVAANGVGTMLMLLTLWLSRLSNGSAGIYISSVFVLIPIFMGIISAFVWRDLKLRPSRMFGLSALNLGVGYGISYLFLKEGVICLIMALPLVASFLAIGTLVGRRMFADRRRQLEEELNQEERLKRVQITMAPVLALLVADALVPHAFFNQETDTITIRARPEQVWRYIIDYPAISDPPGYWLFRLGLPAPVQSTAEGHVVGARRRCLFQGGVAFDERITELEPARRLTFDVISQPNYPEAVDHIRLLKGRFTLRDNGDDTTTLVGTSWYGLNVYPAAYYDLWVQDVVRQVHLRVMRHIKSLAETDARRTDAGRL